MGIARGDNKKEWGGYSEGGVIRRSGWVMEGMVKRVTKEDHNIRGGATIVF